MITILGATGNTGSVVADTLLAAGRKIRVFGRSPERLAGFSDRGADVVTGDVTDAVALNRAFAGCEAAYALIPPDFGAPDYRAFQQRAGKAIAEAVRNSGIPNIVLLSSIGAQHASGTGPIVALHDLEQRLRKVPGLNTLFIRAGYFFENHLASLGLIKQQGINGSAIRPDVPLAMTATRDVGIVAAEALLRMDFNGPVARGALGAADLTMEQATRVIGDAIGNPGLTYVQFPYDAAREGMKAIGLGESLASLYLEMARGANDGLLVPGEERNARNTTPTRFEDFAKSVLAPAYRAL